MRSVLELGAITWINCHPQEALRLSLASIDFSKQTAIAVAYLIEATGTDIDHILALGRNAQIMGVVKDPSEEAITLYSGAQISLLRDIEQRWDTIDGTVQRGRNDTKQRYAFGPQWSENSCAVDCAVMCAVMLDIGRIRVDQISPTSYSRLKPGAALLRRIVSKPWGLLSNRQRSELRDILRHHLAEKDPEHWPLHTWLPIGEILGYLFDRLPQMSWTSCRGLVCCDGIPVLDKLSRVRRKTGFVLTFTSGQNYTIEEKLQRERLDPSAGEENQCRAAAPCIFKEDCARVYSPVMIVLDRLPPTLFISLGPIPKDCNRTLKHMFDRITLNCLTVHGITRVSYLPIGCIFITGGDHFILRWQIAASGKDYIIEYDSIQSTGLFPRQDWWDTLPILSAAPVVLFYRQFGSRNSA